MLTYHKTCAQMSVFIVNTIGMFIKFVDIISTAGRELLNIVWSLGLLLSYVYHQKLFMFGFSYGYILTKISEYYIHWALRGPFTILAYYTMMRLINVYRKDWIYECDPLLNSGQEEIARIMRALNHLGIVPGTTFGEAELNKLEFYEEWKDFVKRTEDEKLRIALIEEIDKEEQSETDEEESETDEEEDEELVECECCGEKDIDPNDLDDSEKNLAEIGGGYAHEGCMSDEQTKEYEAALCGDENEETDEELEDINKEANVNQDKESEEEESIKRGWFNWTKGEQQRKTV